MSAFRLVFGVAVSTFVLVGCGGQAEVARWEQLPGPDGGRIGVLAVDPHDPSTLYAGSGWFGIPGFGIVKSTDAGRSWQTASSGLGGRDVHALAIDARRPGVVWAATSSGVFRTTDGGLEWQAAGLAKMSLTALRLDPESSDVVYAGGRGPRVFKSTDGGESWSVVSVGAPRAYAWVSALAIDPNEPATVYVGLREDRRGGAAVSAYKSLDAGGTWRPTGLGRTGWVFGFAVDPSDSATLYAATPKGVYKSTDGGAGWSSLARRGFHGAESSATAVLIDPRRPDTVYAAGIAYSARGGVSRSTNGGRTWHDAGGRTRLDAGAGLTDSDVLTLAADPRGGGVLYAGTLTQGVFKTTNSGRSWTRMGDGLSTLAVASLAVDPHAPNVIYLGTGWPSERDLYRSTDGGSTWSGIEVETVPVSLSVSAIAFDPESHETVYTGSDQGVYKSTDGGEQWLRAGLADCTTNTLVLDPADPESVYAGTNAHYLESEGRVCSGAMKSSDGGRTWRATQLRQRVVELLAIDPNTPAILYAGTSDGVFKSVDSGETWRAVGSGLPVKELSALVVAPTTPSAVFAGTSRGVFVSENGARTWRSSGLDDVGGVSALVLDPRQPRTVYAGTASDGVYVSADGGESWRPLSDGLAAPWIDGLAVDPSGRVVYAATGAGLYVYEVPR